MEHSKSELVSPTQKTKPGAMKKAASTPKSTVRDPAVDGKAKAAEKEEKSKILNSIKQNSHVTVIQSRWRGRMARLIDLKKSRVVPAPLPLDQLRLRRTGTDYTLTKRSFVQTKRDTKLQRVPLDKISSIEFYVDSAGGLPYSSTVCRVSVKLLTPKMAQIGDEVFPPSYSHPDSDYTSPSFAFRGSWKGADLTDDHGKPTSDFRLGATLLCRIDTLESPSLLPKSVGYAALKLCSDATGLLQPSPHNEASQVGMCLNAGEYLLPLHYGRIPTDSELTEESLQKLPQIEGAFVCVRLFDRRAELKSEPVAYAANYAAPLSKRSAASVLINSHRYALNYNLPALPSSVESINFKVLANEALSQPERPILTKAYQEWFPTAFPDVNGMKLLVNPKFMVQYTHSAGCMLALDMLYNMPPRKHLIKAAVTSATVQAINEGLARGFDNKLNMFKTSFRYLAGANTSASPSYTVIAPDASVIVSNRDAGGDGKKGDKKLTLEQYDHVENIIDDASVHLMLDSHELSPNYADDFSCTAGLQLNPTACILVMVTAVDVLTNSVPLKDTDTEHFLVDAQHQPYTPHIPKPPAGGGFASFEEVIMQQRKQAKEERRKKLEGLIGIHVGHKDRRTAMWGLLPVHVECPCSVVVPPSAQPQTNKLERGGGGSGSSVGGSVHTLTSTAGMSAKNRFFPAGSNIPEWGVAPLSAGSATGGAAASVTPTTSNTAPTTHPCFVNAGVHQIPLYEGLPPEEMMHSPDPMAWLCQNLTEQNQKEVDEGFGFLNFLFGPKKAAPVAPAPADPAVPETDDSVPNGQERKHKHKKPPHAILSTGACAIVRLVDSRLCGLESESLVRDFNKRIDETSMMAQLKARAGYVVEQGKNKTFKLDQKKYTKMYQKFAFFALKNAENRTLRTAIPKTIDPETLIDEINTKFSQTLLYNS